MGSFDFGVPFETASAEGKLTCPKSLAGVKKVKHFI